VPYLALGAIVLAAILGGTALTRRPALHGPAPAPAPPSREVEVGQPQDARADAHPAPQVQPAAEASEPAPIAPSLPAPSPKAAPAEAAPPAPVAPIARAADVTATEPARTAGAPTAPAASEEPDPRKLLAAADRKYAAGRYADAIAGYRRAIAQRSTPAAHVSLARALYDAHRSAEALQELDGVIAESPLDASAWLLRGDIHQGEGRPAEAREAYQRFLELQPDGEQARTVRTILEREQQ
jgi:tetratricopeptide (TPR) repeat protein